MSRIGRQAGCADALIATVALPAAAAAAAVDMSSSLKTVVVLCICSADESIVSRDRSVRRSLQRLVTQTVTIDNTQYSRINCNAENSQKFDRSYLLESCYASALLAMALCPSVCLSVRPSQVGVVLKRLNVGSRTQHHTIARDSSFLTPKISAKFDRGHPLRGCQMQVWWVKIVDF